MIAEVVDAAIALGWALLAWVAVAAAFGSLLLLGVLAGIARVWRALRPLRGHRAASGAPHAPNGGREPRGPRKPSGARSASHTPVWAHSQPLDYEETA